MDTSPLRIECVDISHIQGTDVVASLVVFEDGMPKKSDYRRYKIKEAAGDGRSDDVGPSRRLYAAVSGGTLKIRLPCQWATKVASSWKARNN